MSKIQILHTKEMDDHEYTQRSKKLKTDTSSFISIPFLYSLATEEFTQPRLPPVRLLLNTVEPIR